ncbi:hypothetical protein QBC34DRAFT_207668 [Podospora aff. communis PSN243]|uniref:Uncharacterized protein n=1 Tax=Podospora aff. communis PSN243 TaxID=3040156 RepID=A0AAV9H1X9_9PEZI|nr:hypothetical protein QBC34DRAFT_207668 [Podospora aff. communis PSN243]
MKYTCLYLVAQLASLATSAPAPLHHFRSLEARPWPQPPHMEGTAPGRWKFRLPKSAPGDLFRHGGKEDKPGHSMFNNVPWNPPKSAEPPHVLATERPVASEYLLLPKPKVSGASVREGEAAAEQHRMDMQAELFEVSEMEIAIAIPSRMGTPCHYARLSRERNDVLVVFLAVAFLLVVLTVETWETICSSVRKVFSRRGAIRLEDEEDVVIAVRQPLSIQASEDLPPPAALSEKP